MSNQKIMKTDQKGFTLIELLVVIAIIGILATMSVVALNSAREKARDSRRLSDIKQIQTALEMYYSATSSYPTESEIAPGNSIETGGNNYMASIPSNPEPYPDTSICPGEEYAYYTNSTRDTYTIGYCIGTSASLDNNGIHCATPAGLSDGSGCESSGSYNDPY